MRKRVAATFGVVAIATAVTVAIVLANGSSSATAQRAPSAGDLFSLFRGASPEASGIAKFGQPASAIQQHVAITDGDLQIVGSARADGEVCLTMQGTSGAGQGCLPTQQIAAGKLLWNLTYVANNTISVDALVPDGSDTVQVSTAEGTQTLRVINNAVHAVMPITHQPITFRWRDADGTDHSDTARLL